MLDRIDNVAAKGAIIGAGLFTSAAVLVGLASLIFGGAGAAIAVGICVAAGIGAFINCVINS